MKVTVDKNLCIGCGACISIYPSVFDLNDEGFAYVKDEDQEINEEMIEKVKEAIESCPTDAIKEK